jgi:hypothetical protein
MNSYHYLVETLQELICLGEMSVFCHFQNYVAEFQHYVSCDCDTVAPTGPLTIAVSPSR